MLYTPEKIKQSLDLIQAANRIVITTHVSPDGDAIGSSLGLYHFLKGLNKSVQVITPNHFPQFLNWMDGTDHILWHTEHGEQTTKLTQVADLIFCLDFNDLSRLDTYSDVVKASNAPVIMIDHHEQPKDFSTVQFSDTGMSSTCEMMYEFIVACGRADLITPALAACLYTGLSTDTGFFRHACTKPSTHRVAASLIEAGANNSKITQLLNDTNSYDRLRLIGYALSNKMVYLSAYKTIYFSLTRKELEEYNYQDGDTEGLVNYGLSVADVKMSVFFKESESKIKISFRSKGDFSVQELSKAHFNGGGHFNASGGASYVSMEQTIEKFLAVLPEFKAKLS